MDALKFSTAKEVHDYLTKELKLDGHTITFHIAEPGPEFGSGLIDDWADLDASEAFAAICGRQDDSATITVDSVVTYQIGNGQSEYATAREIEVLENVYTTSPEAFDRYIRECADVLCTLRSREVLNIYYEGDAEDEY